MGVAEPGEAAFDGSSACTLDSITVLSYLSATWRPTPSALEHTLALEGSRVYRQTSRVDVMQ